MSIPILDQRTSTVNLPSTPIRLNNGLDAVANAALNAANELKQAQLETQRKAEEQARQAERIQEIELKTDITKSIKDFERISSDNPAALQDSIEKYKVNLLKTVTNPELAAKLKYQIQTTADSAYTRAVNTQRKTLDRNTEIVARQGVSQEVSDLNDYASLLLSGNAEESRTAALRVQQSLMQINDNLLATKSDGTPLFSAGYIVSQQENALNNLYSKAILENPSQWQAYLNDSLKVPTVDKNGKPKQVNVRTLLSPDVAEKINKRIEVQQQAAISAQNKETEQQVKLLQNTIATIGDADPSIIVNLGEKVSALGNPDLINEYNLIIQNKSAVANLGRLSPQQQQQAMDQLTEDLAKNPTNDKVKRLKFLQKNYKQMQDLRDKDPIGYYENQGLIDKLDIDLSQPTTLQSPDTLEKLSKRAYEIEYLEENHNINLPFLNDEQTESLVQIVEKGNPQQSISLVQTLVSSVPSNQGLEIARIVDGKGKNHIAASMTLVQNGNIDAARSVLSGSQLDDLVPKSYIKAKILQQVGANVANPANVSKYADVVANIYKTKSQQARIFDKGKDALNKDILEQSIADVFGKSIEVDIGESGQVFAQRKNDGSFTTETEVENVVDFIKEQPNIFTKLTGQTLHYSDGEHVRTEDIENEIGNYRLVNGGQGFYNFIIPSEEGEPPTFLYNDKGEPLKLNVAEILENPEYQEYEASQPSFWTGDISAERKRQLATKKLERLIREGASPEEIARQQGVLQGIVRKEAMKPTSIEEFITDGDESNGVI